MTIEGRSEELVSRCIECDLAEPESLASLGGSAPGVVDGILSDGYAMPLTCRGGLMYLSILGQPTDKDLERYPAVHLTGPHDWDPSVLDYTHPSGDGEPPWSNDSDERSAFDPNFDEFGDYTQRAIQTLSILDDSSSTLTPCPTFMANQHDFRTYQHAVNHEAPD